MSPVHGSDELAEFLPVEDGRRLFSDALDLSRRDGPLRHLERGSAAECRPLTVRRLIRPIPGCTSPRITTVDRHERRMAVEVQYSSPSVEAWRERLTSYAGRGITDLWLLGHTGARLVRPRVYRSTGHGEFDREMVFGSDRLVDCHLSARGPMSPTQEEVLSEQSELARERSWAESSPLHDELATRYGGIPPEITGTPEQAHLVFVHPSRRHAVLWDDVIRARAGAGALGHGDCCRALRRRGIRFSDREGLRASPAFTVHLEYPGAADLLRLERQPGKGIVRAVVRHDPDRLFWGTSVGDGDTPQGCSPHNHSRLHADDS